MINMKELMSICLSPLTTRIHLTLEVKAKKFFNVTSHDRISIIFGVWLDTSLVPTRTITALGYPTQVGAGLFNWWTITWNVCFSGASSRNIILWLIPEFYKVGDTLSRPLNVFMHSKSPDENFLSACLIWWEAIISRPSLYQKYSR